MTHILQHIPTGKRVTGVVAKVVADHYHASAKGLTAGDVASDAHSHHGDHGCC